MRRPGAPFDASEPPRGDFVRYVETLNAQSEARDAQERAQVSAAIDEPGPHDLEATRRMIVARAGERLRRAAGWTLLAGIALILLAVVPDDPFIDTPLPGILIAGASLAMRRHFRKA